MAKKKASDIISGTFDDVVSSLKGEGGAVIMRLREMQDKYGVTRYCSTGYPSWDLHLAHNKDRTQYGWPYGRICEVYGAQGSYKTGTVYEALAENIKMGGDSYFLTAEIDFDESYAMSFLKKKGVKESPDDLNYGVIPCKSMKTLFDVVGHILEKYRDIADELEDKGKIARHHLPPIIICADSIGGMISHGDKEKLDEEGLDDGPRMAAKATEIHRFFQNYMLDFARLGVLFLYTNHYRDNLGYGRKKYNPAHDSALKYYPSIRCEFSEGYDRSHQQERSSMKVAYKNGWIWNCKVRKIRGATTLAGEFEIPFYENIGLDWIHSLIDTAAMTDVATIRKSSYEFDFDKKDELAEYNGKYTEKKFRKLIKDDAEFRVKLEQRCMRTGAKVCQEL